MRFRPSGYCSSAVQLALFVLSHETVALLSFVFALREFSVEEYILYVYRVQHKMTQKNYKYSNM